MGIYFGLNPEDQNPDNALKLRKDDTGCCGDKGTICQWASQAITNAHVVNALHGKTPSGKDFVKTFSPAPSTPAAIAAAINAALIEVGYDLEGTNGVFVIQGETTKVVYINTDAVLTKLVVNTNVDRTFACESDQAEWVEVPQP
jgi:hypothetical protein